MGLLMIGIAAAYLIVLYRRDGSTNPFELGTFYLAVVVLYSVVPVVTYLMNGLHFPTDIEFRLSGVLPSDVVRVSWYFAAYMAAFCLAYLGLRKGAPAGNRSWLPDRTPPLTMFVISYVVIEAYQTFVQFAYNLRIDEYADVYLAPKYLPLFQRQLWNAATEIILTIAIAMMCRMMLEYKKYKWFVIGWLAFETGHTVLQLWSRTSLICLYLTFLICYHYFVRRLNATTLAVAGTGVLVFFLLLGAWRGQMEVTSSGDLLRAPSEFTELWGNAYHLEKMSGSGLVKELFPYYYLYDFEKLIPQQIMPISKKDMSTWYVWTFFPNEARSGIGLAFGVIAESMIGFGFWEALARGAILGFIFGALHNSFSHKPLTLWRFVFYLWVTLMSYHTFRATTFDLLPRIFYHFFIPMLVIKMAQMPVTRARKLTTDRQGVLDHLQHRVPTATPSRG